MPRPVTHGVYAIVHEDNKRSLAVCQRHGLTEEMSHPHPSYRRLVTPQNNGRTRSCRGFSPGTAGTSRAAVIHLLSLQKGIFCNTIGTTRHPRIAPVLQ
jgi:hypothetical protein